MINEKDTKRKRTKPKLQLSVYLGVFLLIYSFLGLQGCIDENKKVRCASKASVIDVKLKPFGKGLYKRIVSYGFEFEDSLYVFTTEVNLRIIKNVAPNDTLLVEWDCEDLANHNIKKIIKKTKKNQLKSRKLSSFEQTGNEDSNN